MCVWFKACDDIPTCHPVKHGLGLHYRSSKGPFWCLEPHQRGLWLGGRGVGGSLAPLCSFLPPSTGCQAQRVPLASWAWQWGFLHSQRRVWTGQGVATSCCTHVHEGQLAHTKKQTHMHVQHHKKDAWWVWHMFRRCCRSEGGCVEGVCAGEEHQRQKLHNYLVLLQFIEGIHVALVLRGRRLRNECRTSSEHLHLIYYICSDGLNLLKCLK